MIENAWNHLIDLLLKFLNPFTITAVAIVVIILAVLGSKEEE